MGIFVPEKEGFGLPLLEAGMIKLPIACSDIPPFQSIGDENVLYFSLSEPPAQIAERLWDYLNSLKPSQMYHRAIRKFTWDYIYQQKIKPYLESFF